MGVGIFWIGLNLTDLGCRRLTLNSNNSDDSISLPNSIRIFHDVTLPKQRKNWSIMVASERNWHVITFITSVKETFFYN